MRWLPSRAAAQDEIDSEDEEPVDSDDEAKHKVPLKHDVDQPEPSLLDSVVDKVQDVFRSACQHVQNMVEELPKGWHRQQDPTSGRCVGVEMENRAF